MMRYDDETLERLLREGVIDLVERKESFRGDAPTTVREAVCAFANDLANARRPGVVFIGARDDGAPVGLHVTDELLRAVADIKADGNIVPPPTMTVEKRTLRGAEMIVVTVAPADSPPVRYKGRVLIRIGPRRGIASAQDERILGEKRRHRDQPFDVQPLTTATMLDLDLDRFAAEYLPAAVAPEILEANDRTLAERLAATKMIAGPDLETPTVLGLLVIGRSPQAHLPGAYVQFLRLEGATLDAPIIDEERVDGAVVDVVRRLDDKLVAHNRTRVDFTSGPVEARQPLYPHVALQQLARNAVLHRTYEGTNTPVRVHWFDDRVEIISPGGPFGAITAENFGAPGLTDYRNPNLAEAMRTLGLVQKFGGGIAVARGALGRNGNPPPEFVVDAGFVQAVVRAPA